MLNDCHMFPSLYQAKVSQCHIQLKLSPIASLGLTLGNSLPRVSWQVRAESIRTRTNGAWEVLRNTWSKEMDRMEWMGYLDLTWLKNVIDFRIGTHSKTEKVVWSHPSPPVRLHSMAMFSGVLLGQMQPIQQAAKKGVSPSSDRNCTKSFTRDRPPAVLHDSVHEEITKPVNITWWILWFMADTVVVQSWWMLMGFRNIF